MIYNFILINNLNLNIKFYIRRGGRILYEVQYLVREWIAKIIHPEIFEIADGYEKMLIECETRIIE